MVKVFLRRVVIWGIIGAAIALGVSFFLPKIYQSQALFQVGERYRPNMAQALPDDVLEILDRGPSSAVTELDVLRQPNIMRQSVLNVADNQQLDLNTAERNRMKENWIDYFEMYTVEARLADNPNQQSNIAQLLVRAYDPEVSRALTYELTQQYNQTRSQDVKSRYAAAIRYAQSQIDDVKQELDAMDEQYATYKETNAISDVGTETTSNVQHRQLIERELETNQADLVAIQSRIGALQSSISEMPMTLVSNETRGRNQLVNSLESQLSSLESRRAALLTRWLPDSRFIREVDEQISDTQRQLEEARKEIFLDVGETTSRNPNRSQLEQDLENSKAARASVQRRIIELQSQLSGVEQKLAEFPQVEIFLTKLERERELLSLKYRSQLSTLQELQKRSGTVVDSGLLVGGAVFTDPDPVEPNFFRNGILGLLAGIALGLLYSFGVESVNPRVYDSGQVQQATGLGVAATLPATKGLEGRMMKSLITGQGEPAESFRFLASTAYAADVRLPRSVMVTSIGRKVGRTLSALNYAVALANSGLRVTLVDADPRGSLTELFESTGTSGMINVLAQESLPGAGASLLMNTEQENLRVVPFGTLDGKRLTSFPTEHLRALLQAVKDDSDVVIVDAAPSDIWSDASRLASMVDETLLVFSAKHSSLQKIPAMAQVLQQSGCREVRLIMTNSSGTEEPFFLANKAQIEGRA